MTATSAEEGFTCLKLGWFSNYKSLSNKNFKINFLKKKESAGELASVTAVVHVSNVVLRHIDFDFFFNKLNLG